MKTSLRTIVLAALVALPGAAPAETAGPDTTPSPAGTAAPAEAATDAAAAAPGRIDVDCGDPEAVLVVIRDLDTLAEVFEVHEHCREALIESAQALSNPDLAYDDAMMRLDIEFEVLQKLQRELLAGGDIAYVITQTQEEIDRLEGEIARLPEERRAEFEETLRQRRLELTTQVESVSELREEVSDALRQLRDRAPEVAIAIRLDALETTLAQLRTYTSTTSGLLDRGLKVQRDAGGQETD